LDKHNEKELSQSRSLVDVLTSRSRIHPNKLIFSHHHFERNNPPKEISLTYGQLNQSAIKIASMLQKQNNPGGIAVLIYPPGLDYIVAFMGCLYAGVIAVPAYPPYSPILFNRFKSIVKDCKANYLLSTEDIIPLVKSQLNDDADMDKIKWIATDTIENEPEKEFLSPGHNEEIAFIQYTSGSTSTPKGVCLTHDNLLDNSKAINHFFGTSEQSRGVFWLPLYHDMGLIGGVLQTLFCGGSSILFSPLDFLRQPLRWLKTISSSKATISGGPNFAYDLCVRKASPDQLEGLDLSSWNLAFNGAEPIRHETMMRFYDTFKHYGFRYEALYPCYGLAESTLIVSGALHNTPPTITSFDKTAMNSNKAIQGNGDQDNLLTMVSCGRPRPENRMVIVNPDTHKKCQPSEIGEIWVQSPSTAKFYLNKPEETMTTFQAYLKDDMSGPFLRTGDLGFIHGGELYIAGRLKDLIIIRGKNYYPSDIEAVVEKSHMALRLGCSAAFSIDHEKEEKLVIVQEIKGDYTADDHDLIRKTVSKAVMKYFKLEVHEVVLIKQNTIAKTSSGKIQRHACKENYLRENK